MSTDERNQNEALLFAGVAGCLWLSHYIATTWPHAPGNYNLQEILKFWNKPLWINWPSAAVLFFTGLSLGKRLWRTMQLADMRRKEKEAAWLASKTKDQGMRAPRTFKPIL